MTEELGIGARVNHPKFGEGIVCKHNLETITVFFKNMGDKEISRSFTGLEIIEAAPAEKNSLTLEEVESALAGVLQKFADFTMTIPLGDRWRGGTMLLQPKDREQKPKEVPIEVFFHKIVMVRDRLRVLEQQVNSHKGLSDEEKVNMQQYITRVYGSLTTFNILFKNKEDYFRGEGRDD